ncbi:SMI1/KNR4 family protein [Pseudomonas sp. PIC25]|uniref:SMI1/KNR4 family protein n=1 Tax=Pseudomonas sp. PIC25 TaxID=1958773 RepID=UPI000BD1CBD3|nr:SMI1/KNR4 family protein [Pseudomonas sp. PIC25]PAU51959.1 SMI1/KNR4 family protein [Pseudomonas sp. PIC25]
MGTLEQQICRTLLPGMHLPQPLRTLFSWIEENHLYIDRPSGERIGFLFPEDELRASWTDTERQGGTNISFFAEGNVNLKYWFGHERPEVLNRLCVFAKTGDEGSMAAFWLAPNGEQKIVHLGSGSGSVMVCTLADDPVDFLRLLAIGYDEICWGSEFSAPPRSDGEFTVHPNAHYQQWVQATFPGEIPRTGLEIVKHPDDMHDANSQDAFNQWVAQNAG